MPMLAKSISSIQEIEKFLKKFSSKIIYSEFKYDGERT